MAGETKSKRRTSKLWLAISMILAWGAIYLSIWTDQASAVVASGFGLVGTLYGVYTGVGHLDYRKVLDKITGGEGR